MIQYPLCYCQPAAGGVSPLSCSRHGFLLCRYFMPAAAGTEPCGALSGCLFMGFEFFILTDLPCLLFARHGSQVFDNGQSVTQWSEQRGSGARGAGVRRTPLIQRMRSTDRAGRRDICAANTSCAIILQGHFLRGGRTAGADQSICYGGLKGRFMPAAKRYGSTMKPRVSDR